MRISTHSVPRVPVLAIAIAGLLAGLTTAPPAADAEEVRLKLEDASPQRIFYGGKRKVEFRFELGGRETRNVRIQAMKRRDGNPKAIKTWVRKRVRPGDVRRIRWGARRAGGGAAPNGNYFFRVRAFNGSVALRARARGDRRFSAYDHRFPIRGRHTYGDGVGAGRNHRGQDLFARCGTPLVAARAGRVQFRGNQPSGAGRYVVIDGLGTKVDYVYMHLQGRPAVREGERVRTGERIGRVGATGNASGCHLHFELWSRPGWYEGGSHMSSVTRQLRRWDGWS